MGDRYEERAWDAILSVGIMRPAPDWETVGKLKAAIAQALRDVERETVEKFRKAEREEHERELAFTLADKRKPCPVCGGSVEHKWNCTLNR